MLSSTEAQNVARGPPQNAAETEVRERDQRFRLLVDSIDDHAILMLDPGGRMVTWNSGAERLNDYTAEEIMNRPFSLFFASDEVAAGRPQHLLAIAAEHGRAEDGCCWVKKGGANFWANVVITAIRDHAKQLRGFGAVVRDMTERKRHEGELEAKNLLLQSAVDELEAFSYSVSHDLRAPLRAINAFSRIVLERTPSIDAESVGFLHLVRDNAIQMGHLIDDLLSFSRLNRAPLTKRPVLTSALVAQVIEARPADGREVTVEVGALPDLWGDPALLKQVFVNLIDNAFKYTQKCPAPRIRIGSKLIDGELRIFVSDNGVGFDMQYADKIFDVFARLHRSEEFEGTGVGLAIVHRIIQRHGHRVWFDAEVDKGATFYFTAEALTS